MKEVTITSATRLAPRGCRYVDVAAMPWQEPFPGIRIKVLYKDNEAKETAILFDTQPGTVIPEHIHGGVEWTFVLEGTMEDDEGVVAPGTLYIAQLAAVIQCVRRTARSIIGLFHGSARSIVTGQLFPNYDE